MHIRSTFLFKQVKRSYIPNWCNLVLTLNTQYEVKLLVVDFLCEMSSFSYIQFWNKWISNNNTDIKKIYKVPQKSKLISRPSKVFEPRLLFKRKCFAFSIDVREMKSLILVYILNSFHLSKTLIDSIGIKSLGAKLLIL